MRRSRISGELNRGKVDIVRLCRTNDVESPEELLLACKVVVHTSRIGIIAQVKRRVEPYESGVDAISPRKVIRVRVALIDKSQQGGIRAGPRRVQCRQRVRA